ncbi:MAG: VWA domain-containing protein [Faecousia sp.]
MKLRKLFSRSIAILLLCAMLLSVMPTAFAVDDTENETEPLTATFTIGTETDETAVEVDTEAEIETDAETRSAARAATVTPVQNATVSHSGEKVVGFWLNPSNFTVSQTNIQNLVNNGVTDIYVLVKGIDGSFSTTTIQNIINYAGSNARVHAWMMVGRDDDFLYDNPTSAFYHFRVGYKCNAHSSGSSYYDSRNGYVNLRNSSYQTYFLNQVNTLASISGLDGIHLDTMRYGMSVYDWGSELQSYMGKTDYNTVAKALCVTNGYTYTTNSSGYVVFNGTGSPSGSSLEDLVNANNAAVQKLSQFRVDTITNFVKLVDNKLTALGSDMILSVATMPETATSAYAKMEYGQDASALAPYVDYITPMAYVYDYYAANGNKYDYAWPTTIAKAIAKQGCNVVVGLQGYANEGSYQAGRYPKGNETTKQVEYIEKARYEINGDPTIAGDILGFAVFRAGSGGSAYARTRFWPGSKTLAVNVVNCTGLSLNQVCIQLPPNVILDESRTSTSYTTPDSSWTTGSGSSLAYIYQFNLSIASYGKKDITIPICNSDGSALTEAQAYEIGMYAAVKIYSSTANSYSSTDKQYCCFTRNYDNGNHMSCTFTSEVVQEPTCSAGGYRVYTCSTCGYDYAEYLAPSDACHTYGDDGVCTACGKQTYPVLLHFQTGTDELNWSWQFKNGTDTTVSFRDTDKNGVMYAETGATTANPYFEFTNTAEDLHGIQSGDIVEIRYKISNTTAAAMTPIFRVQTEGNTSYDGRFAAGSAVSTGDWHILQIPIDSADVLGRTIERIAFTPGQSNLALKCEIDYIYIGQPDTAPPMVSFIRADGTSWQDNPVAYGAKAAFFGTNYPTRTGYTFIGWKDSDGNLVDPTTVTITEDTSFYAAYTYDGLAGSDDPFGSTKTLTDPTPGDEEYLITLDAYSYGQSYEISSETPLNITIVLDRSGSMSFPAGTNDQAISDGSTSALTTALNKLDKTKPEGYYVATNWLSVPYYTVNDYGYGFVSFEPLRYNSTTGTWQVWQTKSTDELKTYADNSSSTTDSWDMYCTPFGIVPSSSGSFKNCNEDFGAWVDVTTAFSDFAARRNACSDESRLSGVTLSTIKFQISVPRRSVMMDALESFVDSVYASSKNLEDGKTHRISIVSYGQGAFVSGQSITHGGTTKNYYDSYALVSKGNIALNSDANVNTLKTIIENDYSYGTTRTDAALEAAETYMAQMASSNADAQGVVILATDGVPTSASAFEDDVANAAITSAKALKDNGYQIFTIGYVEGLDSSVGYNSSYTTGTDIQKANNFMHLVSSNFPNATSLTNEGMGGQSDAGYYYSTADGSGLAEQLDNIFTSTITTEVSSITGNIELYDVVKREWTIKSIEVVKCAYQGAGVFDTTGTALGSSLYSLTQTEIDGTDGDVAVSVIWKDAQNAYLREKTANLEAQGYKVEVRITIAVNRSKTLGGNNIPTNGSDSGAYYPGKDDPELTVIYDVPNVNVPIQYNFKVHDYFMDLYTQDSTDLDLLAILNDGADASGVFADMFTRTVAVDGLNNRFVTIAHAVKDAGGTTRYSYNLYNNTNWVPGKNVTGFDFTSDAACTVSFTVNPKTSDTDTLGNAPVSAATQTEATNYYAPKFAVVDFGTKISIPLDKEASLSPVSDYANGSVLTYASGSILTQIETFDYSVTAINTPKRADSNTVQRTAHIIPANNVWYESDGYLTLGEGWTDEGTASDSEQTYDNSAIHGFDAALEAQADAAGETLSNGSSYKANVTADSNNKSMTFSFTGTGFDVISQTGPDEGMMVVEVFSDAALQNIVKRYLVDNYLEGETLYQIPVVHCMELAHGTYYVKIRAYYNDIFNHNYTATRSMLSETRIRSILGLSEDDILEYLSASNSRLGLRSATRADSAAPDTDYDVHVDAIRVYNTLGTITSSSNPVAYYAYGLAEEINPAFSNVRNLLLDADTWAADTGNADAPVEGIVYIAAGGTNTDQAATVEGIHLNMSGVMHHEVVDGVNYLLNKEDQRITHPTYGTDICFKLVNGTCEYYCLDENGDEVALTSSEVGKIIGQGNVVYYNSNYDVNGPKNEVYLNGYNGVAFNVGTGAARVLISAKSVNGKHVYLQAFDSTKGEFVNVFPFANSRVCSGNRTEMYYDVTDYVTSDGDIYIRNANPTETVDGVSAEAGGILSLCNIKLFGSGSITASADTLTRALTIFKAAEANENCPHDALTYTDNGDGTHTVICSNESCDYRAVEAHAFTDGTCICGAVEVVVPAEDSSLAFAATAFSMGAELKFVFIMTSDIAEKYPTTYVDVVVSGAEGETTVRYNLEDMVQFDSVYRVEFAGIAAKNMGDSFTATIHAEAADGTQYVGVPKTASIAEQIKATLRKSTATAAAKTLAVDLLNYGAAAQQYFGYDTEHLVNGDLTAEELACGTQTLPAVANTMRKTDAGAITVVTPSVTLLSKVTLNMLFNTENYTGDVSKLTYKVTDAATGEVVFTGTPVQQSGTIYKCVYDDVGAKRMRSEVTVGIYDENDALVSQVQTWSVESYIADILGRSATSDTTRGLLENMIKYGDSAAAYLG